MLIEKADIVPVRSSEDIVRVRQTVRKWAIEAGFSLIDQTKIVTAASEIARNTVDYGGGGTLLLESVRDGIWRGPCLVFEERGPSIADLKLAMTDGYTSGSGLGLSGAKRLCSEFKVESTVGQGIRAMLARWR